MNCRNSARVGIANVGIGPKQLVVSKFAGALQYCLSDETGKADKNGKGGLSSALSTLLSHERKKRESGKAGEESLAFGRVSPFPLRFALYLRFAFPAAGRKEEGEWKGQRWRVLPPLSACALHSDSALPPHRKRERRGRVERAEVGECGCFASPTAPDCPLSVGRRPFIAMQKQPPVT